MSTTHAHRWAQILMFALGCAACADDGAQGDGSADSGLTGDGDGDASGGDGDGDGSGGGSGGGDGDGDGDGDSGDGDGDGDSGGGDGDGDGDERQVLARDIQLTDMTINQGVQIILRTNGSVTSPSSRAAKLVFGRPALIRMGWSIPDDWEPRILEGRMYVDPDGGGPEEPTMLQAVANVQGPSHPTDPASTFNWTVPGELVTPQMALRIEAWEGQPGQEGKPHPDPEPIVEIGADGAGIGVPAGDNVLKITIVRFSYQGRTPEITDDEMQKFYDRLYEYAALTRIELELHPQIININSSIGSFTSVLSPLQSLHDSEVGYDHIYYGIIDTGSPDLGGAGGMAWSNVSAGLWWQAGGVFPFHTFVHEVGHNLGRPHSPGCGAGGADYSYPDGEGRTQTWGYAVLEKTLKNPTSNYDYMSYCSPAWVSNWTWTRTASVIESVSGAPGSGQPIYIGYEDESGERVWQEGTGLPLPGEGRPLSVTVADADGHEHAVEAVEMPTDDGSTVIFAPMQ